MSTPAAPSEPGEPAVPSTPAVDEAEARWVAEMLDVVRRNVEAFSRAMEGRGGHFVCTDRLS